MKFVCSSDTNLSVTVNSDTEKCRVTLLMYIRHVGSNKCY